MSAKHYLTALGFVATLVAAGPAAAVTTQKIIAADGSWIGWTSYYNRNLFLQAWGPGWYCQGAGTGPGQFLGGAANASCSSTGTGTVYFSGGEWWIDYP